MSVFDQFLADLEDLEEVDGEEVGPSACVCLGKEEGLFWAAAVFTWCSPAHGTGRR
jgi:hypothetical protein